MLLKIFRWFWGYVKFVATGNNIEKFINSIIRQGINLWDIHKDKEKLTGKCVVSEYRYVRRIAKKSGIKVRLQEKHGAPFLLFR